MNIGVDARVLEKKTTGIGRILSGIIENLPKFDSTINFTLFTNIPIDHRFDNCTYVSTKTNIGLSKVFAPFWLNYTLPRYLKLHKIDLFFGPNYYLPSILKKHNIKSIVVVHDVIHKVFPEYQPFFYRKYLDYSIKHSVENSDLIISDSVCSKNDIIRFYGVSPKKIGVIYPYTADAFNERDVDDIVAKRIKVKYDLPEEYILYVGVIEKRKNVKLFIDISLELQKINLSIPIIIVGRKGFGGDLILDTLKPFKGIKYIDFVEDSDLPLIYNLAKIFIFPSFYEGFGFPPLEAMKSGIPIVSSNAGSLIEIIGDRLTSFQPSDYKGMTNEIEKLLTSDSYYQTSKVKCINQAKIFTRERSLENILQAFKKVINN